MTENVQKIFDYLKTRYGQEVTWQNVVDVTGVHRMAVMGMTQTWSQKGLIADRVEVVDGKNVHYIQLTEAGLLK